MESRQGRKYSPEISNNRSQVGIMCFEPPKQIAPSHVSKLNLDSWDWRELQKAACIALLSDAGISAAMKCI